MNRNTHRPPETRAIGLDVGGTKIVGGVLSFPGRTRHGEVLARQIIPTLPERGGQAVLADALDLARQLMAKAQAMELDIAGIGVGVCELVDLEGNVTSAQTVAWQGLPVQDAFSELAPALVESDVRAPAFAEAHFGAGQPFRIFVYVTVGTGISYCLVQDGQPYAGARGNALILASSPLTTTCTTCGTVLSPVLEAFASGPALVSRYNRALAVHTGRDADARQSTRGEEVLVAVEAGDQLAIGVVDSAGAALGVSVGWLVNVLDPEAVIMGGGLGTIGGLYWDSFVASTRHHIWSDTNRDIPIEPATLGVDAGFVGAAAIAVHRFSSG